MKKVSLILLCILLGLLCACSSDTESGAVSSQAPRQSAQPSAGPDIQEPIGSGEDESTGEDEPTGEGEPDEQEQPAGGSSENTDQEAIAKGFIGEEVSALYDAIGYPGSSDYAPSCLGDGDDGNLYYEGFTVYTYREGDSEIVRYVD